MQFGSHLAGLRFGSGSCAPGPEMSGDWVRLPQEAAGSRPGLLSGLLAWMLVAALPLAAAEPLVAVATNFRSPAGDLAEVFHRQTGLRVKLSAGSTGRLYAQIRLAAPYDVFLSADALRPAKLMREGFAVPGSQQTYALGRLILWAPGRRAGESLLAGAEFRHLALAKPELAPYGLAARQTLESLGLMARLQGRLVYGENVGQAFAMVYSGNAEMGLLALSLVRGRLPASEYWLVPETHHAAIRQDLVLLKRGAGSRAARDFVEFLRSDAALAVIRRHGYGVLADHD